MEKWIQKCVKIFCWRRSEENGCCNRTLIQNTEANKWQNGFIRRKHFLEWTSQRPGLNPIEMLWHNRWGVIDTRHPRNLAELQPFYKEELSKIHPDHCAHLICIYRKHLVEVICQTRRNQLLNPSVHSLFRPCPLKVDMLSSTKEIR